MSSLQEIKQNILQVFRFYASFGDRQNLTQLKSNQFHKLCNDANIELDTTTLDLIFCKENRKKSNMDFETFLKTLREISIKVYPQYSSNFSVSAADALVNLLENNIFPLYQNIMSETDVGEENKLFQEKIDLTQAKLIKPLIPILEKIYKAYFPHEPASGQKDLYSVSLKALLIFLKEFHICPSMTTKSQAVQLYDFLIQRPLENIVDAPLFQALPVLGSDFGTQFTFVRFLFYLMKSSLLGYSHRALQESFGPLNPAQQLCLLLERMEMSDGFQSIEKKFHFTHNQQTSLLISPKKMQQICGHENSILSQSQQSFQSQVNIDSLGFTEEHQRMLTTVFEMYAKDEKYMKMQNFKKFLSECALVGPQGYQDMTQIDLIIKKQLQQGKINLNQFLKIMEVLVSKLFGDLEQGILQLNFEMVSNKNNEYAELLMDVLQDEQIVKILTLLHKPLANYFKFYQSPQRLMPFNSFIQFCKDFEVFPNYYTKSKLQSIFATLLRIQETMLRSEGSFSTHNEEQLNQHFFVELLAILALDVEFFGQTRTQKLIFFMEYLQQSQGHKLVSQKIQNVNAWGVLQEIKQFFPESFGFQETSQDNFNQLLNLKL